MKVFVRHLSSLVIGTKKLGYRSSSAAGGMTSPKLILHACKPLARRIFFSSFYQAKMLNAKFSGAYRTIVVFSLICEPRKQCASFTFLD